MVQSAHQHGWAWVGLCGALAVHVVDEASTDFLSAYNPTVHAIHERVPFLPLLTFRFETWLTGLIFALIALLALAPFVFRGARWMVPLSYAFGVLMLINGLAHTLGSIYLRDPMPGLYSSPLLLSTSVYLLICAARH